MNSFIIEISYLIASVFFLVGLKMLSSPRSARTGNQIAAIGMTLAIITTIFFHKQNGQLTGNLFWIFSATIIGTIIGYYAAVKVKMTAMPEMVSMFNGMGGLCAALISLVEYQRHAGEQGFLVIVLAAMIIGSVSFAGSIIAFLKLTGIMEKQFRLPQYNILNMILFAFIAIFSLYFIAGANRLPHEFLWLIFASSLLFGVLFVIPIGGADMPVIISLLNSFTGVAAGLGGFLYDNKAMLTGGVLVGSAGTLLTVAMCRAMNRSLFNVIFGSFGNGGKGSSKGETTEKSVKEVSVSDCAILMNFSKKIIIVPGYGLAVAQAQHALYELAKQLQERGVEINYGIHPVAGRMPGHMNVLLAEANVPYEQLKEMDDVNPEFKTTDVVLVVGANDVVNPAANTNPESPIYGMPILEVNQANHVIIIKRSMKPGYAGIDNDLFYDSKTSMLFGDAKQALTQLNDEVKKL